MRLILVLIGLAALAACVDRDREWASKCTSGGLPEHLCDCLSKKMSAEEREKLVVLPERPFGGGWVLVPATGQAAYCDKYIEELRKRARS